MPVLIRQVFRNRLEESPTDVCLERKELNVKHPIALVVLRKAMDNLEKKKTYENVVEVQKARRTHREWVRSRLKVVEGGK